MANTQTTWVSGGSGSGVYDPVTTTDNIQFSEGEKWFSGRGGRTYNFGTYKKTGLKSLCDEIRNRSRPKCLLITFVAVVLLVLVLLIIVILASRDSHTHEAGVVTNVYESWKNKTTGLNFLPVDSKKTVLIKYSLANGDEDTYAEYRDNMKAVLQEDYETTHIRDHSRALCNSSYNPADVVCQTPITLFNTSCTLPHTYGYPAGQPCVLLTLTLPANYTMAPLVPHDGQVYIQAEKVLGSRFSMDNVGISCEPTTAEDLKYVDMVHPSAVGAPIEYNPPEGFPHYFFRNRTTADFVPPAVMVQFRTIHHSAQTPHAVRFTCTAWGKAKDAQGKEVNPDGTFKTTFVFFIH